MTPEQALKQARSGELLPVYVVTGEETVMVDRVVTALRTAVVGASGLGSFNEDKLNAVSAKAETVVAAARTLPMMAERRLVLLRSAERWDTKVDSASLDRLADYVADPNPSTVLVIVATKINGSRRLMRTAKSKGFIVACQPLKRHELPGWIKAAARERGHQIAPQVAQTLAELVGPELAPVVDAVERLSLYVGEGADITEDDLVQIVTRVRQDTVWTLVDALGERDTGRALAALHDAFDPRDGGLKLLGAVTWSVRQLLKLDSALRSGKSRGEAAQAAGVPPFRAEAAIGTVRRVKRAKLQSWLPLLAEADQSLKSSRRPARAVLETMVLDMCR